MVPPNLESSEMPPNYLHPQSTAAIAGHPIHPMIVPFPTDTGAENESPSETQAPESIGTEPPTPSQTEIAPAVVPEATVEDGADQQAE